MAMCGLYVRRSCPRCGEKTKEVVQASLALTREEVKSIAGPVAPTIMCMKCGKDAGITHGAVPNGTIFANGTATGPPFQDTNRSWYPMYFIGAKGEVLPDFNGQGLLRVISDQLDKFPMLKKTIGSPPHWPEGRSLAGPFEAQSMPNMPARAPPLAIADAEGVEEAPLPEPALEAWDGVGWEPWSHVARRLQEQERAAA